MTRTIRCALGAAAVFMLLAAPTSAHHSFATQYDVSKPVEIKGVVTKVEWTNPHARIYLDVKDDSGQVANWNFEMASPNVLVRNGWKRDSLKIGDPVTVGGYLARRAEHMAIAGTITDANGRPMFASSSTDLAK
jgi:hypothetical protein